MKQKRLLRIYNILYQLSHLFLSKEWKKEISEGCCTSGIWLFHTVNSVWNSMTHTAFRENWTRRVEVIQWIDSIWYIYRLIVIGPRLSGSIIEPWHIWRPLNIAYSVLVYPTQCEDGARDVRVLQLPPVTF